MVSWKPRSRAGSAETISGGQHWGNWVAKIFRAKADDPNISVIIETLTSHGRSPIMAQRYIPEIVDGDKRILLINGEPIPYALARVPLSGETRGNLAAGGHGEVAVACFEGLIGSVAWVARTQTMVLSQPA